MPPDAEKPTGVSVGVAENVATTEPPEPGVSVVVESAGFATPAEPVTVQPEKYSPADGSAAIAYWPAGRFVEVGAV